MIGYLAITLLLAGVIPSEVLGDNETVVQESCHHYVELKDLFQYCRKILDRKDIAVDDVYQAVTDMCRDEAAIRSCMTDITQPCNNVDEIRAALGVSFKFCKSSAASLAMKSFLLANEGKVVTRECLRGVVSEARNTCSREEEPELPYMPTLEQQAKRRASKFLWYIDCFLTKNMTERIPVCSNMTRRSIYAIMITSLQMLMNFGFDYNEFFLYFMEESFAPQGIAF